MKHNILIILFTTFFAFTQAQQLGVFEDGMQRFYIFDEDHFIKAEHLPVEQYWVGKNYVAYVNNQQRFIMYYEGKKHEISLANVDVRATDNYMVYFVDEQVWLFDGNTIKLLDPWAKTQQLEGNIRTFPSFSLSDSIVGFTNSFERFIVAERGQKKEIELWDVNWLRAGENIMAYVDNNSVFKAYYRGETYFIEDRPPRSFVPKTDIIAYIDDFGTFKVWYKDEVIELQEIVPSKYYTGDQMVAYLDDMQNFVCFYDGEMYDILPYKPEGITMRHNILVYKDNRNFLHAFYKGKDTRIAAYSPKKVEVRDDMVVFQDLDGYVKAFYKGEVITVSKEIAFEFEVFNQTIIYKTNEYTWKAYYNGKTFEYLP